MGTLIMAIGLEIKLVHCGVRGQGKFRTLLCLWLEHLGRCPELRNACAGLGSGKMDRWTH